MTHMTAITLGGFDHTNALGDLVVGETVYSYNFSSNSIDVSEDGENGSFIKYDKEN